MAGSKGLSLPQIHAVLMVLGFGFFMPIAIFAARFMRPYTKSLLWFHIHRAANTLALLCILAGFIVIVHYWQVTYKGMIAHFSFDHAQLGLAVTIFAVLQPLNAFFRPHREPHRNGRDGLPGTKNNASLNRSTVYRFWNKPWTKRRVWEYVHHYLGRIAMIGAFVNMFWGFPYLGIPKSHKSYAALSAWTGVLVVLYVVGEGFKFYRERIQTGDASDRAEGFEMNITAPTIGQAATKTMHDNEEEFGFGNDASPTHTQFSISDKLKTTATNKQNGHVPSPTHLSKPLDV
ncbi:hypothetical protein GQ42DRAFT_169118 [Ramicandelaber brevisporus]|nr:hypothetical protein GQ42DRAFT_169118 [Ramicandelaber brevisporus]